MKYIKLFQTIADKQAATLDYPNTNYVVENSKASIEREAPIYQEDIVAKYNVVDINNPTRILFYRNNVANMIVDGVLQSSVSTGFTFDTTGEHTVKYTLADSTTIGESTFEDCSRLTSVIIGTGVTSIGVQAFIDCDNLTNVTIPDSVTSIGNLAFDSCTGLTSVTIPDSVTTIGDGAFQECSGLTSIEIPSGVASIGRSAFYGCSRLTNVTIPDSVTSIDSYAFTGCTSLTSVTVNATTPPTLGTKVFDNTNNCPIYVPAASVDAYKAAANWSTYASRIQAIQ